MKTENKLPEIERKILTVLIKNGICMNTAQIATEAGVSWNTASNYLKEFYKRGWMEKRGNNKIFWKALVSL